MQIILSQGENIVAEFGTMKAAEKFQKRVNDKTFIRKVDHSFFGYTFKNIFQIVIDA